MIQYLNQMIAASPRCPVYKVSLACKLNITSVTWKSKLLYSLKTAFSFALFLFDILYFFVQTQICMHLSDRIFFSS